MFPSSVEFRSLVEQWFSNFSGLMNTGRLGPPSISEPVGLGWGWRICISNQFPTMLVQGSHRRATALDELHSFSFINFKKIIVWGA